jgi:RecJ-like exonuclease
MNAQPDPTDLDPSLGDETAPGTGGSRPTPCPDCDGTGRLEDGTKCSTCEGTGTLIAGVGGA